MELNIFTVRLGQIVITPNALESVHATDIEQAIFNHSRGNWGELCPADVALNDRSLINGCRIHSAYSDRHGRKFWIITEADRSVTTILLPEDY